MGKLEKGILGHFTGTVGTVVGSTWRGIDYLKSRSGKRKKESSPSQLVQQAKFSLVTRFVHALGLLLKFSFNDPTKDMSGINRALAYNIVNAVEGVYPAFSIDYTKALVSEGILHNAANPTAGAAGGGQVKFDWSPVTGASANADDTCVGVIYCPELRQSVYSTNGAQRTAGSDGLDASLFMGKTVQTWIFFKSALGDKLSTSTYTGELVIA